jgi:hypothetical protein
VLAERPWSNFGQLLAPSAEGYAVQNVGSSNKSGVTRVASEELAIDRKMGKNTGGRRHPAARLPSSSRTFKSML